MPLTEAGKKILHQMKEEYGDEKGETVFYSKENGDKKFKKLVTGKSDASDLAMIDRAIWWSQRLAKLPPNVKGKVRRTIKAREGSSVWWLIQLLSPVSLPDNRENRRAFNRWASKSPPNPADRTEW